jgi:hypothetical protein
MQDTLTPLRLIKYLPKEIEWLPILTAEKYWPAFANKLLRCTFY